MLKSEIGGVLALPLEQPVCEQRGLSRAGVAEHDEWRPARFCVPIERLEISPPFHVASLPNLCKRLVVPRLANKRIGNLLRWVLDTDRAAQVAKDKPRKLPRVVVVFSQCDFLIAAHCANPRF